MSATLDPNFALDNSMGAMMIGVIISAVLHGVCLVQAFFYFTKYKNDPWYLKGLVLTTVSFDAIHLCLITHTIYHYLVTGYHNANGLTVLVWSVLLEALFTGVNGAIVQTFFTLRVWRLSHKSIPLTGTILLLILSCVGCGTAWVIMSMQLHTYEELLRISPLTITINALSTTVDVLIASSLCFMLHKARTGFKRSDTIINRLIVFVVNTGMLTTACAIASLISLVASPDTLIYATFYFCIGRLYSNSFLATLNARRSLTATDVDNVNMVSLPTSGISGVSPNATTMSKNQQNISIRIDTTKEALRDNDLEISHTQRGIGKSEEDLSQKSRPL
ncbi:hypothetical protein BDQ12DRAFT_692231 [Crucibulum laeve]|uniref:DUF6534 domain-containing protein n=1 Tax=Crucibulum laeve TaxID=68775 RepID=A0A5C3LHR8_9AGAR|nr:hypothetical protein BDQ12DRAFT_692231 [Crucibulum laeve]